MSTGTTINTAVLTTVPGSGWDVENLFSFFRCKKKKSAVEFDEIVFIQHDFTSRKTVRTRKKGKYFQSITWHMRDFEFICKNKTKKDQLLRAPSVGKHNSTRVDEE